MNLIANKKYEKDALFQKYQWQLFHSSLAKTLELLKSGMTTPEVVCCPDGHFRRAIYKLGPYIADYPEQALLAFALYKVGAPSKCYSNIYSWPQK